MATRPQEVMTTVATEMVARGVDVDHYWGKQANERHDRLPRVLWVETDDDERLEDPWQSRYDTDDGQQDAFYDRAIRLEVTVLAKTPEQSESILDVLLGAGRYMLTPAAWAPARIQKRGERPSSGSHARVLDVTVRLPVLDVALASGTIDSTTLIVMTTDELGDNPEQADVPEPEPEPDPEP